MFRIYDIACATWIWSTETARLNTCRDMLHFQVSTPQSIWRSSKKRTFSKSEMAVTLFNPHKLTTLPVQHEFNIRRSNHPAYLRSSNIRSLTWLGSPFLHVLRTLLYQQLLLQYRRSYWFLLPITLSQVCSYNDVYKSFFLFICLFRVPFMGTSKSNALISYLPSLSTR